MDIPQIAEHDLIKRRNMLWTVNQPGMDSDIRIPGSPVKFHGLPDEPRKASPQLGEDNDSVYSRIAGLSVDKIEALKEWGII
jgi:CoA:oxalate CoA-transferase